jgi:glycolate oxidase subunit GlcD
VTRTSSTPALAPALRRLVGDEQVLAPPPARYLSDETETRGLRGYADAVVLPRTADEVAGLLAFCYERGVPVVPRGGGTGYAGGAVPLAGGVVVSLERLSRVKAFEPFQWRMLVEAGITTSEVRRLARENGLLFPPDPGAAESSQIGGNIATNAGGPHAFKYGVTGAWVLGLEAVVPPGELVTFGGPVRKDVAGYDLKGLLIGSEGTLGIITAAWLKLIPSPEAALPIAAFYGSLADGCAAIESIVANGLQVATLEYLDAGTLTAAGGSYPAELPSNPAFLVLVEADGADDEAARLRVEALEVLSNAALSLHAPTERADVASLWRWRDGVSHAVTARRGGKVSEDIVVPPERLQEAIEGTLEIGRRHGLATCSWGHAGDGNLHSTFLLDRENADELARAANASDELFSLALTLGGSISGEHGTGYVKRGQLAKQWQARAFDLHQAVKTAFDPKSLLNPGKKDVP